MTKKHLIALADLILTVRELVNETPETELMARLIASGIADIAVGDNKRFDRAHFMEACGL